LARSVAVYKQDFNMNLTYIGAELDENFGMTMLARTVRDAWVFGLLPEGQTCVGHTSGQMQVLLGQVAQAWEPYGHLPSRLPPELAQRHGRIHGVAIVAARARGWDPELSEDD